MLDPYGLIALTAAGTLTATLTISAVLRRRQSAVAIVSKTRQALAKGRAIPKRRRLEPAQIAERVVAHIRSSEYHVYPILPTDLDRIIVDFCDAAGIEQPCANIVREMIAALPGVKRKRSWINQRDELLRYVRRRQVTLGEVNDRPTLYWISDLSEQETRVRTEANVRPTPVQAVRPSVRTEVGQSPAARPEPAFVERQRRYA